jgi:hypothetical protein
LGRVAEIEKRKCMNFSVEQLTLNAYNFHAEQRDEEAAMLIEEVLRREPTYTFALVMKAILALAHGDYATGWPLLELLGHRSDAQQYGMDRYPDRPMWDGMPTKKRLLVWASMGRGDMLMMFRYMQKIWSLAPNCVLETHPDLADLLDRNCLNKVVSLGRHEEDFDIHFPLFSSPYLFNTTLDTIPFRHAPYLYHVQPFDTHPYPRIGLFCQSFSTLSDEALVRNLDEAAIERLGARYKFMSLHQDKSFDFLDTARRMKSLALVVTTDSALAHLAGAMGKPTFLMLPVKCCWRWLQNRSDSPWYPSIRIFRQKTPRDWTPVIDEVLQAIDQFGSFSWEPKPKVEETEIEAIRYIPKADTPRVALALGREAEWWQCVGEKISA